MIVKFYDRLDLSRAHLDDVLTVPAHRAKALDVARERHLPRQSLTRATTREGCWVYVFQLRADIHLGTVTLAGAQPGPEHVVTLPVRQLDRYSTSGMPLTEMAGLLAAEHANPEKPAQTPTGAVALGQGQLWWPRFERQTDRYRDNGAQRKPTHQPRFSTL